VQPAPSADSSEHPGERTALKVCRERTRAEAQAVAAQKRECVLARPCSVNTKAAHKHRLRRDKWMT